MYSMNWLDFVISVAEVKAVGPVVKFLQLALTVLSLLDLASDEYPPQANVFGSPPPPYLSMCLSRVCMWSCSSARSSISTHIDSFTDLGLHDKKICTRNDSFTDHGFHDKHIKVEGFIWGVATKVVSMFRHCLRASVMKI
ncbi:hypothetical protein MSG28_006529 [Choristoneura fumiferana]|uniref:Uncharacterized protein n=1 Tax=Choristoneura fumiferana TaxID=7141 RepID=A0ACC0JFE3_CHOFU|nr:hypothetical protein MSG28_006529 [Choristoneura fumiferana]